MLQCVPRSCSDCGDSVNARFSHGEHRGALVKDLTNALLDGTTNATEDAIRSPDSDVNEFYFVVAHAKGFKAVGLSTKKKEGYRHASYLALAIVAAASGVH